MYLSVCIQIFHHCHRQRSIGEKCVAEIAITWSVGQAQCTGGIRKAATCVSTGNGQFQIDLTSAKFTSAISPALQLLKSQEVPITCKL
jgi:hypothetical protein